MISAGGDLTNTLVLFTEKTGSQMNKNTETLIENTLKDVLSGNTALSLLFAMVMALIVKHGFGSLVWLATAFILPASITILWWMWVKLKAHADNFFVSKICKQIFLMYVFSITELLFIYSVIQIARGLTK